MIVIFGLIVLLVTVVVAVVGITTNTGGAHSVGNHFVVLGRPLAGLSTGRLFLDGILLGVVAMLGSSMLLGTFDRRMASHDSRRELRRSHRESAQLRMDRDRLTLQLSDERTDRRQGLSAYPHGTSAPGDAAGPGGARPAWHN